MRQIKFRAWNGSIMMNRTLHDRNWYSENDKMVRQAKPSDVNTLKVMQFTGLQDKNGKDIYEGDILKITFDFGYGDCDVLAEVKWKDNGFYFDSDAGTSLGANDVGMIVGNIHENKELLDQGE